MVPQVLNQFFNWITATYYLRTLQPESPVQSSSNIFDNLLAFKDVSVHEFIDEITRYLRTGPENVQNKDLLMWWYERKHIYPHLYRMALNYHTIPGK